MEVTSMQITTVGLFFLSGIIGLIGFLLKGNWTEIKNTQKEILTNLNSLTTNMTEIKADQKNSFKNIEIFERKLEFIENKLSEFASKLAVLETKKS